MDGEASVASRLQKPEQVSNESCTSLHTCDTTYPNMDSKQTPAFPTWRFRVSYNQSENG